MKILPCRTSGCSFATLPNGKPYVMGRTPDDFGVGRPFTYRCARCKRSTTLKAAEWNQLPEATLEELRKHGLAELATKDLKGAGASDEQIAQLEAAGVDWASLHQQQGREVPLTTWHAKGSKVYHRERACTTGNNIEPDAIQAGDGGLKLCAECKRIGTAG